MKLKNNLYIIIKALQILLILPKIVAINETNNHDELYSKCSKNNDSRPCISKTILLSNSTNFNYYEIKNLIVFGDSHSAIGTSFKDMTYTGKSHARGKLWSLYMKEFNKNLKLWSFAISGASINRKFIKSKKKRDLIYQYEKFYENMSEHKKFYNLWNKNDSLFIFWFGAIDIGFRKQGTIDEITESLFNIINKIYDIGAKNILILGAPPLYLSPLRSINYKAKNCSNEDCSTIKNDVIMYNKIILEKSKIFFENHSDVNLIYYSTIDLFDEIINHCDKYKFKDCIHAWGHYKKKPIEDFFWADAHMTYKANKILAEDIEFLLKSIHN